jgi:hypothetical protein
LAITIFGYISCESEFKNEKMKYLFCLIMLVSLLTACKKEAFQSDFAKSRDAWQDFKKASNNSYSYTVTSASWTGFSSRTQIMVTNGIVTGRNFTSYTMDGQTGQRTTQETWSESTTTLNSHSDGAAAITMDAVYEMAATVWLKADVKQNAVHFEAKNNGMISTCGYVPAGCMDDCFIGIHIAEISPKMGLQ